MLQYIQNNILIIVVGYGLGDIEIRWDLTPSGDRWFIWVDNRAVMNWMKFGYEMSAVAGFSKRFALDLG